VSSATGPAAAAAPALFVGWDVVLRCPLSPKLPPAPAAAMQVAAAAVVA
jgi:hypothetical protein